MNKIKFVFRGFIVVFLTLAFGELAAHAASRTFVSTDGNDANSCGRKQPCRTFAAAVNAVDAGGEVVVLDSGGYGAVTITKAVSIIAPDGVYAAINQSVPNPAVVIAAGANDKVVLRGLTLNGVNSFGINFESAAALQVEKCVINGFNTGILFDATGKLSVKDTLIRNAFIGIRLDGPSNATIQALIDRTRLENNSSSGILVGNLGNPRVSITDSIMSGNTFDGLNVSAGTVTVTRSTAASNGRHGFAVTSGVTAVMNADYCTATGNGDAGFLASGGAGVLLRASNSTASDNQTGFGQVGSVSVFESYGNNRVRGNTSNTTGLITNVGEI